MRRQPRWHVPIRLLAGPLLLAAAVRFAPATAGGEPPIAWLTGAALSRQLAKPVDVFWSGMPLRQALEGLARTERAAVLIDRRVDPGQELQLRLSGVPLEQVWRQVAESRNLGVTWLGGVAYFGPPNVVSRTRTLAELRREEAARLPAAASRKLLAPRAIRWDDFATPRDLLTQLASESGIELVGLEQVPHDLWAGADLPPLSLVDRLTLVAGQFDLTFQVAADGSAIALVPVPEDVAIVRAYAGGPDPAALAHRWKALVPQAQVKVAGNQVFVRGLLEDHERIAGLSRATPPQRASPDRTPPREKRSTVRGEKRFTVREGKGQLGSVLQQLAENLGLSLQIDRAALDRAGISLQQPVAFSVENATLDELFQAVLGPAGCSFRLRGNVLEVRPAQ